MASPEGTSWQSLVRARMREEIDEWVAEGRREPQTDRPLVLIDVMGVVSDTTNKSRLSLFKNVKITFVCAEGVWRRDGDSNPGGALTPTRFPGVRLKPLGHPSQYATVIRP